MDGRCWYAKGMIVNRGTDKCLPFYRKFSTTILFWVPRITATCSASVSRGDRVLSLSSKYISRGSEDWYTCMCIYASIYASTLYPGPGHNLGLFLVKRKSVLERPR